jgi:hypothetical protein
MNATKTKTIAKSYKCVHSFDKSKKNQDWGFTCFCYAEDLISTNEDEFILILSIQMEEGFSAKVDAVWELWESNESSASASNALYFIHWFPEEILFDILEIDCNVVTFDF